ncbi:MAG TPA: non-homologous end-joining DNA ligase [Verrucomicrobiae bacterium]|nr:non-homologous end-joining DNA ligase [Verrucomicrobiae bacterium]
MVLQEYRAKRDFKRTREPPPRRGPSRPTGLFVVQKHDATRLHYDFRLEMDGVLKSWAVPKGFPMKRGDRRLAIQVEDHPFEYRDFEGTIPEGNYGAGTVMVWDSGTYEVSGGEPARALEAGKLHLILRGHKLKGEWTLVQMRSRGEDKPQWLLLKSGADLPPLPRTQEDRSVLTGRSLAQIAGAAHKREWQSNRTTGGNNPDRITAKRSAAVRTVPRAGAGSRRAANSTRESPPGTGLTKSLVALLANLPSARPGFVPPMKAVLAARLPEGRSWVYEIKFDGVRALAIKDHDRVRLVSRNEKELTTQYALISKGVAMLPVEQAVLDGEVVAVNPEGVSSFQLLQTYQSAPENEKPPLLFYVFDVLNIEGKDVTALPLWQRKEMAERILGSASPAIRFSGSIHTQSQRVVRAMQARGLEGLLAKQKDSPYQAGKRSGAWVKFKWSNEQEFVIGGYTEPKGSRAHFGALLVGYYEQEKLIFAAKVGTGFDERLLSSLYQRFQKLIRPSCPFANLPEKVAVSRGLTAREMRACTWLEPKLVCQVRFAEWTRDGHLRQPAFLGLREDKNPREVAREKPTSAS